MRAASSQASRREWFSRLTLVQKFSLLSLLCVLGITVAACATGVTLLNRQFLEHDASVVGDLVQELVTRSLPRAAFTEGGATHSSAYARALETIVQAAQVVRVVLFDANGRVLWSDDGVLIGQEFPQDYELQAALAGRLSVGLIRPRKGEHQGSLRHFEALEEIYVPVRYERDGPVVGALEIYRDPPALFSSSSRALAAIWLIGGGGGFLLWLGLLGVVSRAARAQAGLERELVAHTRTLETRVAQRTEDVSRLYEDMKRMKEYLENLIESSADVILTVGRDARVSFASRAVERVFGFHPAALYGLPAAAFWARGLADYRRFRRQLLRVGRVQAYETELRRADGGLVPVTVSASLLRDAGGQASGAVVIVADVTELRKLYLQTVRSERLATAGLLAAGIAHEIGNPLACIASLVDMLSAKAADGAIRSGLDDVRTHASRIEKIVEGLTQLARPAPPEFSTHAVSEIVGTAVQLARHNPAGRLLRITARVNPALPHVRVAGVQILQVFLNLILNAAESGGDLTITATAVANAVHVTFRDTGRGIAPEDLPRLFDPFFSTKEHGTNMGLGLFVSHEIVRQHGGWMLAESRLGHGATFTVVLPAQRDRGTGPWGG